VRPLSFSDDRIGWPAKPRLNEAGDPDFWFGGYLSVMESLMGAGETSGFLIILLLDEAQDLCQDRYLDFGPSLKGGLAEGRGFLGDLSARTCFNGIYIPARFSIKRRRSGAAVCDGRQLPENNRKYPITEANGHQLNPSTLRTAESQPLRPEVSIYNRPRAQIELVERQSIKLVLLHAEDVVSVVAVFRRFSGYERTAFAGLEKIRMGAYPAVKQTKSV